MTNPKGERNPNYECQKDGPMGPIRWSRGEGTERSPAHGQISKCASLEIRAWVFFRNLAFVIRI